MEASSVSRRLLARVVVPNWAWWRLPLVLRCYVGTVVLVAFAFTCFAASQTTWHASDAWRYALLLGCGLVSVAATPRMAYLQGGMTRDFLTVWVLPVAILLPPIYAMVTPVPLYLLTQWRVHRGVVYRRVFSGAGISLAYGAAALVFRAFPESFAGRSNQNAVKRGNSSGRGKAVSTASARADNPYCRVSPPTARK